MSDLKAARLVRDVPDFPKPGILFKDITPVLADPEALHETIGALAAQARSLRPDRIVGIESRGFLFGAPIAVSLEVGFVPFRKAGKLPYQTLREEYALEYGTGAVEAHVDAFAAGDRVVIVDDVLATGGTAAAAAALVERLGAQVAGFVFLMELAFLDGRARIARYPAVSLLTY